jgi:hypothetical protein
MSDAHGPRDASVQALLREETGSPREHRLHPRNLYGILGTSRPAGTLLLNLIDRDRCRLVPVSQTSSALFGCLFFCIGGGSRRDRGRGVHRRLVQRGEALALRLAAAFCLGEGRWERWRERQV